MVVRWGCGGHIIMPNEEKFDIWMGSSHAMAREKTWKFVVIIGNLLLIF